ncbi:MAG: hypothetical protein U1F46_16800 [Marinagarivorans sp.]
MVRYVKQNLLLVRRDLDDALVFCLFFICASVFAGVIALQGGEVVSRDPFKILVSFESVLIGPLWLFAAVGLISSVMGLFRLDLVELDQVCLRWQTKLFPGADFKAQKFDLGEITSVEFVRRRVGRARNVYNVSCDCLGAKSILIQRVSEFDADQLREFFLCRNVNVVNIGA